MMKPAALLLPLLIAASFAGCIIVEPQAVPTSAEEPVAVAEAASEQPSEAAVDEAPAEPRDPRMTGEVVSDSTDVGSCIDLGPAGAVFESTALPFACAERRIRIAGIIEDVDDLPVKLASFNGFIDVSTVEGNEWSLVARLDASGLTEDEARQNAQDMHFEWTIGDGTAYVLHAIAAPGGDSISVGQSRSASLTVEMPVDVAMGIAAFEDVGFITVNGLERGSADLQSSSGFITVDGVSLSALQASVQSGELFLSNVSALTLVGSSASGSIFAEGIDADDAHLLSSSGDVFLTGATVDVLQVETHSGSLFADAVEATAATLHVASGDVFGSLTAANGKVSAESGDVYLGFVPSAAGVLEVVASSGTVNIELPETDEHGYDVAAMAASGDIWILLEDGETVVDEDGHRSSFVTDGFETRAIQTVVSVATHSGDIYVSSTNAEEAEGGGPLASLLSTESSG